MNIEKLHKILADKPKFRLKQAKEAIFKDLIGDWKKATVLPLDLRQELNKECPLKINGDFFVSKEKDSTKALIRLEDGLKIESVLLRHSDNRNTVCVSSQAGCPLNCSFCATGKMGFKRNLEYFEIVEQVIFFARLLKKENKRVSNMVFMGMGEPFLNYDNVLRAIKIINAEDGLNIGARHISISTVGIIEGIKKLAKENLQINLAISLHSPNNKLREQIMPINKKYPIERVLQAVDDYMAKTKRKVMFEYLLINNVNDTRECALELAKLMKKPLYFLNLIPYNPTGVFESSPFKKIKEFKNILEKSGVNVAQRYRFGQDIGAACGQLAGKN